MSGSATEKYLREKRKKRKGIEPGLVVNSICFVFALCAGVWVFISLQQPNHILNSVKGVISLCENFFDTQEA